MTFRRAKAIVRGAGGYDVWNMAYKVTTIEKAVRKFFGPPGPRGSIGWCGQDFAARFRRLKRSWKEGLNFDQRAALQ